MAKTLISWTDETANWIVGCTKTRAKGSKESGCDNCYAANAANSARLQRFDQYKTVVDGKGGWNGHIEFVPKVLDDLLKGNRVRRVFTPSMSDPFHPEVKDEWLDRFIATVVVTPHITYQVLTKRPERMLKYFESLDLRRMVPLVQQANDKRRDLTDYRWKIPFPNLWLGGTTENQAAATDRIPLLQRLGEMGFVTFVSVEPILEDINLSKAMPFTGINWAIIGGESGVNSRPFHLEWAQSLIEQCRAAKTKVFMKQVGSNAFCQGEPFKTKSRSGSDASEWPEWARIQEFPTK